MKLQNGPPGARAFSRLPSDKKGKALGTRLKYMYASYSMNISSQTCSVSYEKATQF
jgi:hypothetical protein